MNEIQTVQHSANGGTLTVQWTGPADDDPQVTAPIAFDADGPTFQAAMEALSNIGAGKIAVATISGGWRLTFQGALGNLNLPEVTVDSSLLTISAGDPTAEENTAGFNSPNDDLKVFWKLADLDDAIGSNDLTNNGSVTFGTGKVGDCAEFDGTNYLSAVDSPDHELGDFDFTIAGWVYLDPGVVFTGDANGKFIWARLAAVQAEYALYFGNFGVSLIGFFVNNLSSGNTATAAVPTGEWFFAICQYDSVNDLVGLSINNGTLHTAAQTGGPAGPGSMTFTIGARYNGDLNLPSGCKVDALGIWHRLLSDGEKAYLYSAGGHEPAFSSGVQEVQILTLPASTSGGTWKPAGTTAVDWDASAGDVEAAIETDLGEGVAVTGTGPYTVTFDSTGNKDLLDVADVDLVKPASAAVVNTIQDGSPPEGGRFGVFNSPIVRFA